MRHKSLMAIGIIGLSAINVMTSAHAQTNQINWSGFYAGGSLGAIDGRASFGAATADDFSGSYFSSPDADQIASESDNSLSQSKLTAGLFGGFGKQYNHWYLGIETNINSFDFDETTTSGAVYESNPVSEFRHEMTVKSDWQAMLRSRVGWAERNWLAYLTAGVAVSRFSLDASFSDDLLAGAAGHDSESETKFGWVVGLGGEYALSENWSIRGEYLYVDYGKVDTNAAVNNASFPVLSNNLKSSVDLKTQILSLGVSYRF